jgi:uncharacterized membrane protein YeaQ/YmgE (transglycosylase-associated protein family)
MLIVLRGAGLGRADPYGCGSNASRAETIQRKAPERELSCAEHVRPARRAARRTVAYIKRRFSMISSIIGWLILGLIAGFIASKLYAGTGQGVVVDIILGIVGAFVGGFIFNLFFGAAGATGGNGSLLYSLIVAVIGAIVVLWIYHAITGRRTM